MLIVLNSIYFPGLIVSVKKKSEEKVEILSMQKQELDEQVLQLESKVAAQKVKTSIGFVPVS